ncbi:hypothetical protein LV84_02419 [Algoriphagus ratkowskyi]|uniref:Uncharacterized protein n=1 Tax=Algoriphagus ratkowskyi TaxID=57028 RepID=A0A2W7SYY2_9BACT|nr:hypothetical protein [Algoriphagus ratkowskyi]PZX56052.1 hypothetical protein LV84_02419 [Algoriphagus ratkowskyi]TXD77141.1 hypothetical protein ESW18_12640 [Algoriphagus ratkowskyi]
MNQNEIIRVTEEEFIEINEGSRANAWKMIEKLKSIGKIHHISNDSGEDFILNGITKEELKYNPEWFEEKAASSRFFTRILIFSGHSSHKQINGVLDWPPNCLFIFYYHRCVLQRRSWTNYIALYNNHLYG